MYPRNTIGKRRPSGWTERRRYFRGLFNSLRTKTKDADTPKETQVSEKH